jgi:hypothetical protein
MVPFDKEKLSGGSAEPIWIANVSYRTNQTTGVAMDYRNDLVPLTLMGALSAAILTVFVVTVHM